MATFLDTSALVRRYAPTEPGSRDVRALCAPSRGETVLVARIASVEMASALARKQREGVITAAEVARVWRVYRGHRIRQYATVALSDEVIRRAEALLFWHPLRTYDAMQIGCALVASRATSPAGVAYWTADRRQAQAATAEGLTVRLIG